MKSCSSAAWHLYRELWINILTFPSVKMCISSVHVCRCTQKPLPLPPISKVIISLSTSQIFCRRILMTETGLLLGKAGYLFFILSSWWMKCFTNVYITCPDVLRATVVMPDEDKKITKVRRGQLLSMTSVCMGCKTLCRWAATESHSIPTT